MAKVVIIVTRSAWSTTTVGDGFKAAKRAALAVVGADYPGVVYRVRDCWRRGKVYASFLVDVID
jgi:hypothetical protein